MAKPSARQKANQFLSQIGTAGGTVGAVTAPQLVAFGAGDLANQVISGSVDQYAAIRGQGAGLSVGSPDQSAPPIVPDLAGSYLQLNLPGSPLPAHGLLGAHSLKAAQALQDRIVASNQAYLLQAMPVRGQLVLTPMETALNAANQLQKKTSNRRGGRR